MKKRILTIVVACFLATVFYMNASAGPTPTDIYVDLRLTNPGYGPYQAVTLRFRNLDGITYTDHSGIVAGVYHLQVRDYPNVVDDTILYGFCVENRDASRAFHDYRLWTIGDDGEKYEQAAWLAENYFSSLGSTNQNAAATQIAIWEACFETDGILDVTDGYFKVTANGATLTQAQDLLDNMQLASFTPSKWYLAISPPDQDPDTGEPQDFIVPNIPEPGTMLLLGTGLLGLYGYARRKRSSRTAP